MTKRLYKYKLQKNYNVKTYFSKFYSNFAKFFYQYNYNKTNKFNNSLLLNKLNLYSLLTKFSYKYSNFFFKYLRYVFSLLSFLKINVKSNLYFFLKVILFKFFNYFHFYHFNKKIFILQEKKIFTKIQKSIYIIKIYNFLYTLYLYLKSSDQKDSNNFVNSQSDFVKLIMQNLFYLLFKRILFLTEYNNFILFTTILTLKRRLRGFFVYFKKMIYLLNLFQKKTDQMQIMFFYF